jgi:phospholipase C
MTAWRLLSLALTLVPLAGVPAFAAGMDEVKHVIIIYGENRSFDNLYGLFPNAEGIATAEKTQTQVSKDGKIYKTLPQPMNTSVKPPVPDTRFPANLPNKPFDIAKYVPIGEKTGDLVHRYWHEIEQIDGGKMDKFAAWSDAAGLAMGYYDGSGMALWKVAQKYTLADHFFHGAFGGSFLNHVFFVCACTPRYENAPAGLVAKLDPNGHLLPGPDVVRPDGYAVNTMQTVYKPHSASITETWRLLPPQTMPTIGDRMTAKGIEWAWYSGGWDNALAGKPDALFQFHHQAFAYFENYGDGTEARAKHLKDYKDFEKAVADGSLPPVAFYKPIGGLNQHPGYTDVMSGDKHIADVITAIEKSPIWKDALVIITYDEHGGFWDHVPPPKVDEWGPGLRVPALFIGPMVKKGFIDHTTYQATSILTFIEKKFGLEPLSSRDRDAPNLTNFFE